jgi:dienelactone hydrolase
VPFQDLSSEQTLQDSNDYIDRQLRVRVGDVEFVVAQLEKYNSTKSKNLFSGRLDLNRLGIFGYSFGGAVAAQACWQDKRFKAGIDLDGSIFGEVANDGVRQPFLFLFETTEPPGAAELGSGNLQKRLKAALDARDIRIARQSVAKYGSLLTGIAGTRHANFTDPPAFPAIGYYLRDSGRLSVRQGLQIINAFTVAFFEKYLDPTVPATR